MVSPKVVIAGALAFALALAPLTASAGVDLKSLLADPPTSDFVEADPTPSVLDGPFTAESYGAFIQAGGSTAADAADTVSALHRYKFVSGYSREWEERASQDLLIERVFEFGDSADAGYWYADVKLGSKTSSEYAGDIPGVSTIPNSFGIVLKSKTDSDRQWRVDFHDGNFVFVIHTDSFSNDLSGLAVGQARTMYGLAGASPSPSPQTGSANLASRVPGRLVMIAGVSIGALVVLAALLVAGMLMLAGRDRRRRTAAASSVPMSPDWAYWWDGATWRPAATSTPPSAPRSPDGAFWWDGASWRPVAR